MNDPLLNGKFEKLRYDEQKMYNLVGFSQDRPFFRFFQSLPES